MTDELLMTGTETSTVALAVAMGHLEEGTKHIVEGLSRLESKVDSVGGQVSQLATRVEVTSAQVTVLEGRVDQIETNARTALERTEDRRPTAMMWVTIVVATLALLTSMVGAGVTVASATSTDRNVTIVDSP